MNKLLGLVLMAMVVGLTLTSICSSQNTMNRLFKSSMKFAYSEGRADEATRMAYKLGISTETPKYSSFEDFYKKNFQDEN